MRKPIVACVSLILLIAQHAYSEARFLSAGGNSSASSTLFFQDGSQIVNGNPQQVSTAQVQNREISFNFGRGTSAGGPGGELIQVVGEAVGEGSVDIDTNILTFTGTATASCISNDVYRFEGTGISQSSLVFEVTGGSATMEFLATFMTTLDGPGSVSGFVRVVGGSAETVFERTHSADSSNPGPQLLREPVSLNLSPGQYILISSSFANLTNNPPGPSTSLVELQTGFGPMLTVTPSESGDEIFWAANDGNYNDSGNWEPEEIPGADKTAVFDRDSDYTVTFTDELTGRAIVERGEVTFSGLKYTLSEGTEDDGSLGVGRSAGDAASLFLKLSTLNTEHAIIGDEFGTDGAVLSSDSCDWTNNGRLSVGKAGIGGVTIENQAELTTAELRLGDSSGGIGTMVLRNSGMTAKGFEPDDHISLTSGSTAIGLAGEGRLQVESGSLKTGAVEIGSLTSSMGMATVRGTPMENDPSWVADSLTVGKMGNGTLTVLDGNALRVEGDLSMGNEASAEAGVMISGRSQSDNASTLAALNGATTVGGSGVALVEIEAGAICAVKEAVIGESPIGDVGGSIFVRGKSENGEASVFGVFGETLQIGKTGTTPEQITGVLSVEDGAAAFCQNAMLGYEGGRSFLTVAEDCEFMATGNFLAGRVNAEFNPPQPLTQARIVNNGLIQAATIVLEIGTESVGDGIFQATHTVDLAGTLEPAPPEEESKGPAPFAVMTFKGEFNMLFGEFILDVGGASEAMTDRIAIIGDANITGGTVTFNFVDGYLPKTGEMIPFLGISGNTIFENVAVAYTGAAEGFEYSLVEQDGMVMLEALNDAQPTGGGPTPVPTALNPAADVNRDKVIDADDLLEVMRNWYRVVTE